METCSGAPAYTAVMLVVRTIVSRKTQLTRRFQLFRGMSILPLASIPQPLFFKSIWEPVSRQKKRDFAARRCLEIGSPAWTRTFPNSFVFEPEERIRGYPQKIEHVPPRFALGGLTTMPCLTLCLKGRDHPQASASTGPGPTRLKWMTSAIRNAV